MYASYKPFFNKKVSAWKTLICESSFFYEWEKKSTTWGAVVDEGNS